MFTKTLFVTLFIGLSQICQGQLIEFSTTDSNKRNLLLCSYPVNSNLSSGRIEVSSGLGTQISTGELASWSLDYTATPGYAGYGGLTNRANGLMIRASGANGEIRFLTGGADVSNNNRMTILPNGNVGIGTTNPATSLQLESGALFLKALNAPIIMKSANGSCWALTVSNAGALSVTSTGCPQ